MVDLQALGGIISTIALVLPMGLSIALYWFAVRLENKINKKRK